MNRKEKRKKQIAHAKTVKAVLDKKEVLRRKTYPVESCPAGNIPTKGIYYSAYAKY